jgi:hypothetical protein
MTSRRAKINVRHIASAIRTSDSEKGELFIQDNIPSVPIPNIYASSEGVFQDATVDVVFLGTLHVLHKKNCLDAIAAGNRIHPLAHDLCKAIFADKLIGNVRRTSCDFSQDHHKLASLGPESRLRNLSLGADRLLTIGIYSLTWGFLTLDDTLG